MNNIKKDPCYFGVTDKENIYQVSYELTNMCNLECAHCCNQSSKDAHTGLSKENIISLIDELASINAINVYLTGGEPTFYPHFREIIQYIRSKDMELILATNGYDIEPHISYIKEYVSSTVGVFVSLDGIAEVHDEFRQKQGAFNRAIYSLKLLASNGIPARVSTVIWKKNVSQIEELIKLVDSLGVYQIHFTVLVKAGRAKENDIEIESKEYSKIVKYIEGLRDRYTRSDFNVTLRRNCILDHTSEDCKAGTKIIHINSKGEISPCSWIAKSILKDKYSMQWVKGNINECLNRIQSFYEVVNQRKLKYGYSGCPAMAAIYGDNGMAEDPLNDLLVK